MTLSKKPYKGTRDLFPKQKRLQNHLFDVMKKTAHLFGYEPYDGPLLEEVDLYKAKSGEELINDQIYSFLDRGERFVAIRPEMTPTLARMVAQIHREYPRPIRWYSIPNLYRYERPQKGRTREHWQFNCDIFGAPETEGELEIIQLAITLLTKLGASSDHFKIVVNDRRIVDGIFKHVMKLDEPTTYRLYKIVDKSRKIDASALDKMLAEIDLSQANKEIFQRYLGLSTFDEVHSMLLEYKLPQIDNLKRFSDHINKLSLDSYVSYDPTIVRGLDYYTGFVFEIFDKNPQNPRALCGGGSYANLLGIFNEPPLPGVGFGLGDITLGDFLKTHNLLDPSIEKPQNDLFLTFQNQDCQSLALDLATKLRECNINVITHLDPLKVKKVFPLAEKKGARFVALMGDHEYQNNLVQIKNMETKEQFNIPLTDIDHMVEILKSCQN